MPLSRYLRLVWLSALYDLLVTAAFATPWTARFALTQLSRVHGALGAGGTPPPAFEPLPLFFVSLFGTVVVMWALLRLVRPRIEHGLVDGMGRVAFSVWMLLALASGETRLLTLFLVPEITFGIAQLAGWARVARAPGQARAAT
ncbi:Hypothetical protein A7982_11652 [Minicystis rosea]|nr:Hypothetical protein A7982_11652 [Minicystis rosea]